MLDTQLAFSWPETAGRTDANESTEAGPSADVEDGALASKKLFGQRMAAVRAAAPLSPKTVELLNAIDMTVLSEAEEAAHTASIRVVCGPLDEVSAIADARDRQARRIGARRVPFRLPDQTHFQIRRRRLPSDLLTSVLRVEGGDRRNIARRQLVV